MAANDEREGLAGDEREGLAGDDVEAHFLGDLPAAKAPPAE